MTHAEITHEFLMCQNSPAYFIATYCQIYDAEKRAWIPFRLWSAQFDTLKNIHASRRIVILKARQLGMTWLVLAFALWLMLFEPAATILLFSKRDDEATDLLDFRLKGIYQHLPAWLQCRDVLTNNEHEWQLSNGSRALSFPTTGGRSYTASMGIVDEADYIPDLNGVINAVQPTVDAGGRIVLLSTANKETPQSQFKLIYREAKNKVNGWFAVFLAWHVAPWRSIEWYERKRAEILANTTSTDDLFKEYPATEDEALAPASKDKRIPYDWIKQCYVEIKDEDALLIGPAIEGLRIYCAPEEGHTYVIGADPAEGNPTSDDSALEVTDALTGEEVAALANKFQPEIFGAHIDAIGRFFNHAAVLVERNNHGHAVLLWLKQNSKLRRIKGPDGKDGWNSTSVTNALLYDYAATAFRERTALLHNFATQTQLSLIEGASLSAPEGEHDDRADALALSLMGRNRKYTSLGQVTSDAERQENKWRVDKARAEADEEDDEVSRWRIG